MFTITVPLVMQALRASGKRSKSVSVDVILNKIPCAWDETQHAFPYKWHPWI